MTTSARERPAFLAWARPRLIPVVAGGVAVIAVLLFLFATFFGDNQPSSGIGETLGILAALTLVAVMAHSARRSRPQVRSLGPARAYYNVHVWGGLLFFVLLLLHTDFSLPRSGFGFVLWTFSLWVVATGAIGWFLQWLVPKVLASAASFEVNYQRIPEFVGELRARAEGVVSSAEPRIKAFYEQQMAADFAAPRMSAAVLIGRVRAKSGTRGTGAADMLRRTLSPDGAAALDSLSDIQAMKHDVDLHFTLQRVLRAWLFVHLPVAIALLGVVVLHVFFIAYF